MNGNFSWEFHGKSMGKWCFNGKNHRKIIGKWEIGSQKPQNPGELGENCGVEKSKVHRIGFFSQISEFGWHMCIVNVNPNLSRSCGVGRPIISLSFAVEAGNGRFFSFRSIQRYFAHLSVSAAVFSLCQLAILCRVLRCNMLLFVWLHDLNLTLYLYYEHFKGLSCECPRSGFATSKLSFIG